MPSAHVSRLDCRTTICELRVERAETNATHAVTVAKRIEDFKASKLFRKGHVIIKPVTPRNKDGRFLPGAAAP